MKYRTEAYMSSDDYVPGVAVEETSDNRLILHKTDGTSEEIVDYTEIDKAAKKLQADYDAKSYQRNREYPPIGDQLDEIYHKELAEWKKTIKAVKGKHPKPE